MMSKFKHTFQHILGALLLTLFVGYFVGTAFFLHKHIVDGKIIVHSHPFSSTEQHSHSSNVLNFLQQISHFESKTLTSVLLIFAYLQLIQVLFNYYKQPDLISNFHSLSYLRPPPTVK